MFRFLRRLLATSTPAVVDYSFARPPLDSIRAAGAVGVIRYISSNPSKCITVAEAKALYAAGVPFALVYEDDQDDFAGGANAGAAKAVVAAKVVKALVAAGVWSLSRPIYCAVDENAPQSTYLDTWEGIQTFAKSVGCAEGAYGPRPFLRFLETSHGVVWLFELGSSSFNTGDEPPTNKRIQQEVTVPKSCKPLKGVDWDTVLMADWGQFPAPVAPKPPAPKPAPLTPDQYAAAHGMVQIDSAEALQCVSHKPEIAWYEWVNGKMVGHSDKNIPTAAQLKKTNSHLYAFKSSLDAAGIKHGGA